MIFEPWRQDLRLAWVGLRTARAFTAAAVLTLAVGIAGTTAVFALIEGVLPRPLPVREQDRLLVAWKALPATGFAHWPFRAPEIDVKQGEPGPRERRRRQLLRPFAFMELLRGRSLGRASMHS